MSRNRLRIDDALENYPTVLRPEEPTVLARLREETSRLELASMQIGRNQGRFMTLLLCCLGARRTIEVGVFTGYSTLITALALPKTGRRNPGRYARRRRARILGSIKEEAL